MLTSACDFAKARYVTIGRLRNWWGIAWFVLGASVVLFLTFSILSLFRSDHTQTAIGALGTILDGAAVGWVTKQRKAAVDEDEKAFAEVVANCKPSPPAVSFWAEFEHRGLSEDPALAREQIQHFRDSIKNESWFQELEKARQSDEAARRFLTNLRRK